LLLAAECRIQTISVTPRREPQTGDATGGNSVKDYPSQNFGIPLRLVARFEQLIFDPHRTPSYELIVE
jgi:hypothetical protein